jgi:hypothetical protein
VTWKIRTEEGVFYDSDLNIRDLCSNILRPGSIHDGTHCSSSQDGTDAALIRNGKYFELRGRILTDAQSRYAQFVKVKLLVIF